MTEWEAIEAEARLRFGPEAKVVRCFSGMGDVMADSPRGRCEIVVGRTVEMYPRWVTLPLVVFARAFDWQIFGCECRPRCDAMPSPRCEACS